MVSAKLVVILFEAKLNDNKKNEINEINKSKMTKSFYTTDRRFG